MGQIKSNLYRVTTLATLVATMPVGRALAEDVGTTTDYAPATSSAASTSILAGFWIFFLVIAAISLVFFIWWILMLLDAFKRTNWKDDSQKTTWLVILIVGFLLSFGWLVTILYYFMIRKPLGKAGTGVAPAAVTPKAPAANSTATTPAATQPPQTTSSTSSTTTPTTKK